MTQEELDCLQIGDVIRHVSSSMGQTKVVTGNYGRRVTAVETFDVTNPPEWELVAKATYNIGVVPK